jgi:transcription termination/antitermination protein NusG
MKPPTPMSSVEILRMLGPTKKPGAGDEAPPIAPPPKWLQPGDRVRVVDGTFNGMDGSVKQILEAVSKVQVELAIFGRPVNVDFEYYQVEQV